jgi:hypothetical protein
MKKGKSHGKRQGDRDTFMRIRVSKEERAFLHGATSAMGITVSLALRRAMVKSGLLPDSSADANNFQG